MCFNTYKPTYTLLVNHKFGASSSGLKRKATPLDHDHHNKRPHFSHDSPAPVPPTHYANPPDIAAATASPLDDDDHSKRVCHDAAAATPDDDGNAEFLHFVETQLTIEMADYLDSNASALTAQHLEPATADHQQMIPPADYHAPVILDPPQATTTSDGEFGEKQGSLSFHVPADFPEFSIDECNLLLQATNIHLILFVVIAEFKESSCN